MFLLEKIPQRNDKTDFLELFLPFVQPLSCQQTVSLMNIPCFLELIFFSRERRTRIKSLFYFLLHRNWKVCKCSFHEGLYLISVEFHVMWCKAESAKLNQRWWLDISSSHILPKAQLKWCWPLTSPTIARQFVFQWSWTLHLGKLPQCHWMQSGIFKQLFSEAWSAWSIELSVPHQDKLFSC